jgi:uncharacterized protein (DUF362 family)
MKNIFHHPYFAISRRRFLKLVSFLGAGLFLNPLQKIFPPKAYAAESDPVVLSVYNDALTDWAYPGFDSNGVPNGQRQQDAQGRYYYDSVNQIAVKNTIDKGIMQLTGKTTPAQAWISLLTGYQPGHRVAIKINWNGIWDMMDAERPSLESIKETTNSVIQGLIDAGIPKNQIFVGDASRTLPGNTGPHYKSVHPDINWVTKSWPDTQHKDFAVNNSSARVAFTGPDAGQEKYIANFIVESEHLINIYLLKNHNGGITGAFKNHFGSVYNCETLHATINTEGYSCLAHIGRNSHIHTKTRLCIADAIFGCWVENEEPRPFKTLSMNSPKRMFFSKDPVALDSVLLNFMEWEITERSLWWPNHFWMDYIHTNYPELGHHDHWNNSTEKQYANINFQEISMNNAIPDAPGKLRITG